ncbi:MAG: hypothetical protein AAGG81_03095 [Chlamydiota bacterium]
MSIPGAPLPEIPRDDASSPVPIPKTTGASSSNLYWASSDGLFASEEEGVVSQDPNRSYLLPKGMISLFEFVKIINQSISQHEQTQEALELMDAKMNKRLHQNLAQAALYLRRYRSKLHSYLTKWVDLEEEIESMVGKLNRSIRQYLQDVDADEGEIEAFNQAVKRYNDPASEDYGDQEMLMSAAKRYSTYSGEATAGTGRNGQIHLLNQALEEYNNKGQELNRLINSLNLEREQLGLDKMSYMTSIPLVKLLPKVPEQPFPDPGKFTELLYEFPHVLKEIKQREKPDTRAFMDANYDPVHNVSIGYFNSLESLLNVSDEYEAYDGMMKRGYTTMFLDLLMVKFAKITFGAYGEGVTNDHSLAQAVSWATLEKLLANASVRASMLEARIPLMPNEVDQIQLLILNLLTKSSMQAATGPAFQLLGSDLGHVGVGEGQMSLALAYGFMHRMRSLVGSDAIKTNVSALIDNNPRLSSFPEKDRGLLIRRLTSIVSLAILQNGVVHAAVALGIPGLVAQVLGGALQGIGISKVLGGVTANDALQNRAVSVFVQSALGKVLSAHGFGSDEIGVIVSPAIDRTLGSGPYTSAAGLADNLAMQLHIGGVPDLGFARALSFSAVGLMLGVSPHAQLDGQMLNAGFSLGLVDSGLLLSDSAVKTILGDLDIGVFGPIFRRTVGQLFSTHTMNGLVGDLNGDPLMLDIDAEQSPKTLREVLVQLYRGLVRQGVSIEDSLGIAESTLKYLLRSSGAQAAFSLSPADLKLQLNSFQSALTAAGLPEKDAYGLSGDLVIAGLSSPGELNNIGLTNSISEAVATHLGSLKSVLGGAAVSVIGQQLPELGDRLGEVGQSVIDAVFGGSGSLGGLGSLQAAIRRGLVPYVSSEEAVSLSSDLLNSPAANPKLRYGGASDGSVGSVLLDSGANEAFLSERLIDQGISGGVSGDIAKILVPYLHQMDIEGKGVNGHLEDTISSQLFTSRLYASGVLDFVDENSVFDVQKLIGPLAESLVTHEQISDLTEAMAVASLVTKNVTHVQGSVSDMVHYQNAILTNLETGWGVDKNAGSDLVASLNLEDAVNRDALIGGLTQGMVNAGESVGNVDALARDISSASFTSTDNRSEDDAVRGAARHALMSTLGVEAGDASRVSNAMDVNGIFDGSNLREQVANLLEKAGVDDVQKVTDDIVSRQMSVPNALNSVEDFQKAFQDAAYITGVSPQTAVEMSQSLRIDHIMHPEMMQLAAVRELHNAGFSEDEAKKLASQASQNLFQIGSSQIDLQMTAERLKEEAVNREFAVNQLTDLIMGSDVVALVINKGDLQLSPLRNDILIAVDRAVTHRQSAYSEEVFRNILRDEIAFATNVLDSRQAEMIAQEVVITDTLRKELFVQELIHRANEHLTLGDGAENELRMIADETYRDINAFTNEDAFNRALLEAMRKRDFIPNITAEDIVKSTNTGIVLENIGSLFTPNSAQLMPQLELREELTNILLEKFQGAIPPEKAKRISEEFIMLLLGPLTTAYGKANEESMMDLIKVQLEELIKHVSSKNYRKLILQGVTDTMTSSTQVNFDTFLFTEILNVNGMRFLKIIQEALLNNIGVEDRDFDKTIDLLI